MIVVLVCVAVIGGIVASTLRLAATQRRAVQRETWETQAVWLAESGLERAAAQLTAAHDYEGETWKIPPEQIGCGESAVVMIEVLPAPGRPGHRTVRVSAAYPDDPIHRCRRITEALVAMPIAEGENP